MSGCGIRMSKCFWCGKDDGIIIPKNLSANSDKYCPSVVVSYEPCQECKDKMDEGVWIIEVRLEPVADNQAPIAEGTYPTGRFWVVKAESFDGMKKGDQRFITQEVAKEIGLYQGAKDES